MAELRREQTREYADEAESRAEMRSELQRILDDLPEAMFIVEKRGDTLCCRAHGMGGTLVDMMEGMLETLPAAVARFRPTMEDEHNG